MQNDLSTDVLIIGAGPSGTTLAIDLARRGHSVRIIDKAASSFAGSRAKGIQPRTLEVMDDLGVYDRLKAAGDDYPLMGLHLGPLTIPWRMIPRRKASSDIPFPNTWLIPQYRTDHALAERLAEFGVRIEYDTMLETVAQDDAGVTATVLRGGDRELLRARYLVGADGGGSAVREGLRIGFPGETHEEDRMIIVDADTTGLRRDRWHVWPGSKGRFVGACPLPDGKLFQWMIKLPEQDQPDLSLAAINARVQRRVGDRRIQLTRIQWQTVFRPNIRLADRYRHGRVFLIGDAAHVHPPAGAQGLNTGVQDAYNLGWKLGQVLSGADSVLLDTYEAERRPIAAAVLALSTRKYAGIERTDPASMRRGKDESQLTISYAGGPLAPAAEGGTTRIKDGDRAPDATLRSVEGKPIRLFELLRGPHFTAIAFGWDAIQTLEKLEWPAGGAPLRRVAIGPKGPPGIDHFLDSQGAFRRNYGPTGDVLFLIRPDGYVGHVAAAERLDTTGAAVVRLAGMTVAIGPSG